VLRRGATTGTSNYNQIILYQRYEYGNFTGSRQAGHAGRRLVQRRAPTTMAVNADSNTGLQVTTVLPVALAADPGSMIYVTEIYTRHTRITPLDRFGVSVPETLYSIAYF
jgi:hypothetical protein